MRGHDDAAVLIVTAVATAASFLGTEPMLRAMNTPENIFSDSAAYIGIIFLGWARACFTICSPACCAPWATAKRRCISCASPAR